MSTGPRILVWYGHQTARCEVNSPEMRRDGLHVELLTSKGVIQVLHACFVQSRAILNLHIWDGSSALPNLELAQKLSLVFVS